MDLVQERLEAAPSRHTGWISALSCAGTPDSAEKQAAKPGSAADRVLALFEELRDPLMRYLRASRMTRARAEDILQETFLELHRALLRGGRPDNVRGWVFRVAHNFAVDQYRSQRLEESLADQQDPETLPHDPSPSPEQAAIEAQKLDRLAAAIETLSPQQRQCLHLRAEGLRYREIAEVLGISTSTVGEMLRRAMTRLSQERHE